jgi:5-methylcytosine-specific restriction protein B
MTDADYPEFYLQLPYDGPRARGRLLRTQGKNGSPQFLLRAGSPARAGTVKSFKSRQPAAFRAREELLTDGVLRESTTLPGYLELTEDVTCNSPSSAAEILMGSSANGFRKWRSADDHPVADYIDQAPWGPVRGWLVRESSALGPALFERVWLPEGRVTLSVGPLRRDGVEQGVSKAKLRGFIEEDFDSSATYSQKLQLEDATHAFLSRMKPGDTICTVSGGALFVGELTGTAEHTTSPDGRSSLRRPVEWSSIGHTVDTLPEELQQRLSAQHDIVELTTVLPLIEGLGLSDQDLADEAALAGADPATEPATLTARRELELPQPTPELSAALLLHNNSWLGELRDLLWDDRQLVLYGPPGTGKTYLALKLAEFLGGGPEQVKLVQFHPSYSYEDFFEGFRPQEHPETGDVAFRLTPGPLRELADLASREGNRHIPHFLIIDEINRANLAKVFGELYFLLEYRNRSVRLTYSGEDFALPPNLFVIGTMNTADRSIALVDAAMRRRFAFVELSPRTEPTSGLLRRWLAANDRDPEPADLLDALNSRIADPDFRIGPSYLMKPGTYRAGGLERTWRTKILPLLAEHHYGEGVDVERKYGIAALQAANSQTGNPPG